jgi:hypothetical protein
LDPDLYLDLDPYSDPDSLEMLDPDPSGSRFNESGSTSLVLVRYSPFVVDHPFLILCNVASKKFLFCKEII